MKISYMLCNKSGKGRTVPSGQAWQWIHQIEDEKQMLSVFAKLKKRIRECRLTLANLQIEQRHCSDEFLEQATFTYKGPIIYDDSIIPKRIINIHEDSNEEDKSETT
jgi:hypothetical protein